MGFDGLTRLGGPIEGYAEGEEPVVFQYNRERWLASSPQNVQDYHAGKIFMPKGFFRAFTATPGLRLTFITMLGLFVMVVISYVSLDPARATVGGVSATLLAAVSDGQVFVAVELAPPAPGRPLLRKARPRDGNGGEAVFVQAEVRFFDGDSALFAARNLEGLYAGEKALLRTNIEDYDILKVEAQVFVGDASTTLKRKIAR
jgi:hypothetical protein